MEEPLILELSEETITNLNLLKSMLETVTGEEPDYDTIIAFMLYKTLGKHYQEVNRN